MICGCLQEPVVTKPRRDEFISHPPLLIVGDEKVNKITSRCCKDLKI